MSDQAVLELGEVLDLKAAGALHAELLTLRGRPIEVDASKVQRLGGLCLQVLVSAEATWRLDDQPFLLAQPSPEFDAGWALFAAPTLERVAQPQE
jgi:chemotaxis protein CheX